MCRSQVAWVVLFIASLATGCQLPTQTPEQKPFVERPVSRLEVSKDLMPWVRTAFRSMHGHGFTDTDIDKLCKSRDPDMVKLLSTLTTLGAKAGPDGKVHDAKGKEVAIWVWGPGPGCQMDTVSLRALQDDWQRQVDQLRRTHTVIEMPYRGPHPP